MFGAREGIPLPASRHIKLKKSGEFVVRDTESKQSTGIVQNTLRQLLMIMTF